MAKYNVLVTDRARSDMEDIHTYIAEELQAPEVAIGQYSRIADAILSLQEQPKRIKLMGSKEEHAKGLRRLNVDNYAVFFYIKGNDVIVVRVLYGASDIADRLRD